MDRKTDSRAARGLSCCHPEPRRRRGTSQVVEPLPRYNERLHQATRRLSRWRELPGVRSLAVFAARDDNSLENKQRAIDAVRIFSCSQTQVLERRWFSKLCFAAERNKRKPGKSRSKALVIPSRGTARDLASGRTASALQRAPSSNYALLKSMARTCRCEVPRRLRGSG